MIAVCCAVDSAHLHGYIGSINKRRASCFVPKVVAQRKRQKQETFSIFPYSPVLLSHTTYATTAILG